MTFLLVGERDVSSPATYSGGRGNRKPKGCFPPKESPHPLTSWKRFKRLGGGCREVLSEALALWQPLPLVSLGVILLFVLPFLSLSFPRVTGDQGLEPSLRRSTGQRFSNSTSPTGRGTSGATRGGRPLNAEIRSPGFEPPASR